MKYEEFRSGIRRVLVDGDLGTYSEWDDAGILVDSRPLTPDETAALDSINVIEAQATVKRTLEERLTTWRDANRTFLRWNPAKQDVELRDQVARLTRQNLAMIKLLLADFDSDE